MATPTAPVTDDVTSRAVEVSGPARVHRRRGQLLVAIAVFQFWLWGTRIWNLVRDAEGFSTAFVAVHAGLYVTAVGVGVILAVLGVRMWREAQGAAARGGNP